MRKLSAVTRRGTIGYYHHSDFLYFLPVVSAGYAGCCLKRVTWEPGHQKATEKRFGGALKNENSANRGY